MADNPYLKLADQDLSADIPPVVPAANDNPYMDLAKQDMELSQQRLKGVLDIVSPVNPDHAAEALKLSRTSGLPQQTVQDNLDEVRRQERVRLLNLQRMMAESPVLARQLNDPVFASIAQDQTQPMSNIEMAGSYIGRSLQSGGLQLTAAATKLMEFFTPTTSEEDLAVLFKNDPAGLKDMRENGAAAALSRWSRAQQTMANAIMEGMPAQVKSKYGNMEYLTTDTDNAAYLSPVKMIGDVVNSLPTTIALMGSMYLTKSAAGSTFARLEPIIGREAAMREATKVAAETMAYYSAVSEGAVGYAQQANQTRADADKVSQATLEKSPAYQDLVNVQGYSPEAARIYLSATTAEKAGTMAGMIDAITNFYGGRFLGKLINEGGALAPRMAKGFLTEGLTEAPQSMGEQFAQNLAMQQGMNPDQSLTEGVGEAGAAGFVVGGLTGGTFSGVFGRASDTVQQGQESAMRANQMFGLLNSLNDMASANKVRERDVQTFEGFMQSVEQEAGPINTLYIDPKTLVETLQAAGANVRQVAESLPSLSSLDENLKSGTLVAIPVSEFAARIAGTDYAQALMPHLQGDPSGMSKVQADEFMQNHGETLKAEVEKVLADKQGDETFKASMAKVKQQVLDEIASTQRFTKDVNEGYATLMSTFYGVTAAKLGITPEAMAARYPIKVSAEGVNTGEQYDQAGNLRTETPQFKSWFKESKVVDDSGKPKVMYHATTKDFSTFRPSFRGAYFVTPDQGFANDYLDNSGETEQEEGSNIMPVYVRAEKTFDYENPEHVAQIVEYLNKTGLFRGVLPGFFEGGRWDSIEDKVVQRAIKELGYDSFYVEEGGVKNLGVYEATQIKSAIGNNGEYDPNNPNILNQEDQRDLLIQHNLSEENLLHALKMGGIPVPSLAVVKKESPLTNFGEITLLGDKDMADPRGAGKPKVFGADIYSPRYPKVTYVVGQKKIDKLSDDLKAERDLTGANYIGADDIRDGVQVLRDNSAVMAKFLETKGIAPDVVMSTNPMSAERKADLTEIGFAKYFGTTDSFDLTSDEEFKKLAVDDYNKHVADIGAGKRMELSDEERVRLLAGNYAREIVADARFKEEPDRYRTRDALRRQIESGQFVDEYNKFTDKMLQDLDPKEKIFTGYTNSGNRKYIDHNIENVVKLLKKELRGGEGFNYGVGSLRAKFTPEFKSIKAIRENKDRLMSAEQFEEVKSEIDDEFVQIAEGLGLSLDQTIEVIEDTPRMGAKRAIERAFKDYKDDGEATEEQAQDVAEFTVKLRNLPTAYFEAKILRNVELSEFSGAVVPANVDPKVIEALKERGITDIRTYDGSETDRAAKIQEFDNLFFQEQRGKISFANDITQAQSVITLMKSANLSTFLHESGHFFLEVTADIASRPDAPKEIQDDMQTILKWFGVPNLATWKAMDIEQRRPMHEKFARGFEAYLFEGKSPSLELNGIFQRFRAWLVNVYKQVAKLNVEIDDEIRGVFDRMVASSEAIQEAEQARTYVPLFTSKPPFMTDEEWLAYQQSDAQASQDAVEYLEQRSMRDMQWVSNAKARIMKAMQKEHLATRKDVRREVENEVMGEPVYRAREFLKRGTVDGQPVEGGYKLSIAEIEDMYGDNPIVGTIKEQLGFGKYGMLGKENGIHPQQVADMFGFSSGDHLVRSLLESPDPAGVINERTDARMLERYGDLNSPEALSKAADEAIHNDARARFVATEANALAKATGRPKILAAAAKDFAQQIINRLKIRNIRPTQYAASASRAAKNAAKTKDLVEAATEKRNQLINTYAAKAAFEAQQEVIRAVRYFRRFESKNIYKTVNVDYLEQIHALLERFDLRTSTTLTEIDRRASLINWVESQRAKGIEPVIAPELLDDAYKISYKEMSLEDFRGLVDAVKNIEHLGRLKDKLLKIQDRREFMATATEAGEVIRENATGEIQQQLEKVGIKDAVTSTGREVFAFHRKFASLIRQMDGFKDGGTLWSIFSRPMNEAGAMEATMREQATVKLGELYKLLGKVNLKQKLYIPEIGGSLSLEGRLAIALNMGNETNMRRVMEGENWNPAQVNAVIGSLTREQWNFVQGTWDFLNSYWPEISAKERRMTGITPEKVEARPFVVTLKDGTQMSLNGGYYPIKYNPARSSKSEADTAAEVLKQMERGLYTRAQTARGHIESRVESVGRPMRYDLGVIDQHLNQVIHDLSWHEYLVDANRLLRSGPVDSAIREHYGPEILSTMRHMMEDIAIGEIPTMNVVERGVRWVRSGVSIASMGWNLITAFTQPLGLTQSMVRIGPKWVARGMGRWLRDASSMESTVQWITSKSEFMRVRAKTQQREISEIRNTIQKGETRSAVEGSFFYLIGKLQLVADVPTWLGQYEKAMAENPDEARAIAMADQAVLDSQGGGQIKDLSQAQRGNEYQKLWTNFYSYFNVTYNLLAEKVGETRLVGPSRLPLLAVDVLMLTVVPATLGFFLKAALKGKDLDDEDKLAKELVAENISYLMGTMVGLRELNAAVSGSMGYEGPAGARFFSDVAKFVKQADQGEADEAFWRSANELGGVLLHYPALQIDRTVRGILALSEGNTENPIAPLVGPPPKN